ncbi:MAG: 4a-hydroxytetrahydrobiopterin dehydratase [Pseudonocardiales bacterium]|nr:4a-hydroxytetrahydrobiopterin dehydratase [Pseudonocardiales bacterium]
MTADLRPAAGDVLADFDHTKHLTACTHELGAGHDHADGLDHSSCGVHLSALDSAQLRQHLLEHPQWSVREGRLRRRYDFGTFDASMHFVTAIAEASRAANHHPDIHIENKRTVYLVLWTHKAGAITRLDLSFAQAAEQIFERTDGGVR